MKANDQPHQTSLDIILSKVLLFGVITSLLTTGYGGILLMWQHGGDIVDYALFVGVPVNLKSIPLIISNAFKGDALAITQLGTMLMIITPTIRVLSCAILFAYQRDLLYVVLSVFVLIVLVPGLIR